MIILADTATLFSPSEGEKQGMKIIPVCVAINDKTYNDYTELSNDEFLKMIEAGGIPSTSQPSLGDVLEVFESTDDEIIMLTVGDGLSGGYQTALSARNQAKNQDRIHVLNSKTLAGPLRYLAKKAVSLKEAGANTETIKEELLSTIETSISFVIPEDFDFLKRSGRLTKITAKVGGALKLLPVLTQTEDKTRIKPVTIKRTWKSATEAIIQRLKSAGINHEYLISVCHAGTEEKAKTVAEQIKESIPDAPIDILHLSPSLITHGGPGCIVVQAIKM